jgi:hypothetical protein
MFVKKYFKWLAILVAGFYLPITLVYFLRKETIPQNLVYISFFIAVTALVISWIEFKQKK